MVAEMEVGREKECVSAQKAVEILKNAGAEVTEYQAGLILDFLEKMANIALDQFLNDFEKDLIWED